MIPPSQKEDEFSYQVIPKSMPTTISGSMDSLSMMKILCAAAVKGQLTLV